MKALIFDIEIEKAIQGRGEPLLEGIQYCEGWHDHRGMGISTLCAYDYASDRYRVFCKDNVHELRDLIAASDRVVGFNSIRFDEQVLRETWAIAVQPLQSYDILQEIWNAHGLGPTFNPRTHGGFGLDRCAAANFQLGKTGNGALAPVDWQRGRYGSVIDYCLEDVRLTKLLFDKIVREGEIVCPKTGKPLLLRNPFPHLRQDGESSA